MPLEEARIRCPILAPHGYVKALCRPSVMDIDVDALHQGQLRRIRARGGVVMRGTPVRTIAREATTWRVEAAGDHRFVARHVVNAAGAWADEVALMAGVQPIGLVPKRRTAVLIDLPDDVRLRASLATWPMVTNLADTFYFKPESGRLMACPSDETPLAPCDVQPEELDVATAVARIEEVTTLQVRRVTHKWAGLRSVVVDEAPVLGEAPDAPGFFWAAALGGFGIQSAPATGRAVATLVATGRLPDDMRRADFNEATLSPARLRRRVARRLEFD
jgi:D-arginine dehydrogenase